MKLLKFANVIEYCIQNKCNAFALIQKKHEIFVCENNEGISEKDITIFYSKDSGSENESSGYAETFDVNSALEEFPVIKELTFFPFNKDDAEYDDIIYYYASRNLLNAAKLKTLSNRVPE